MSDKPENSQPIAEFLIQPFDDRVVIKPETDETLTAAGLHIPHIAIGKKDKGTVIGAGPNCKEAKVGDLVLFPKFSGSEHEFDNVEYVIMRECDIIGKLTQVPKIVLV